MLTKIASLFVATALAVCAASAQTPVPMVVQAIPSAGAVVAGQNPPASSALSPLKLLQDLKAANAEILKKQTATLQQLDEIQKAAEQLKIYSKRG